MASRRAWYLCIILSALAASVAGEGSLDESHSGDGAGAVLSRKRRYLTFPEGSSLQVVYDQTIPIIGLPLMYTIGVTVAIAYELPSKPWYHYLKDIRKNLHNSAYLLRKDQNVSQLTYTDQGQKPGGTAAGLPAKANLLDVAPTYSYNPGYYNKHAYYYKDAAAAGAAGTVTGTAANIKPFNWDKQQQLPWNWNRNDIPSRVSYYSNPTVAGGAAQAAPPPSSTKLQPVSSKLGYYFGKAPNQLASVGNQLSQWMKYLPMKLNPKQPIYWSDVVKGIKQMATKRQDIVPTVNQVTGDAQPPIRYGWRKGHKKAILPVFGKRSVDEHIQSATSSGEQPLSDDEFHAEVERLIHKEEQKHFTRHHRHTRHDLYGKIEAYLNSKGLNGRECVLRTLCETGHRHQARHLPSTFVAEIIKTIFRLPKLADDDDEGREQQLTNDVHISYDLAHQSNANCTDMFPDCSGDLWNHPFLY